MSKVDQGEWPQLGFPEICDTWVVRGINQINKYTEQIRGKLTKRHQPTDKQTDRQSDRQTDQN